MAVKKYYKHGKLKAFLKIIIIILITIILSCFKTLFENRNVKKNLSSIDGKEVSIESIPEKAQIPDDITINLVAIGDIMCHNTQYMDAAENGKYDFSYVFEDIADKLMNADYTVGNLETTFAGADRGYSSYPTFNTPENLAIDLKEAGIDLVSTANNHSLDKGYSGIKSTINYLDQAGVKHTGTYISEESRNDIIIADIKGIKTAFLSFTYGTNGIPIPSGKEYCIDLIDDNYIVEKLNLAKKQEPDLICVFMHWGDEYETIPSSRQKELANLLFSNGANIILGSHPHVLQKMEKIENVCETENDGFVIYSLGNFMSGQVKENTRDSIILNLSITKKGTGEILVNNVKYTPIYTYRKSSGSKRYKILDIRKAIDLYNNEKNNISYDEYNVLSKELNKIVTLVGDEI